MSESNKTYRINTDLLKETSINLNLTQNYDSFSILSINVSQSDLYKLHSADYGVIVGRVIGNGNFGIPNAKISVFIERDPSINVTNEIESVYPYTTVTDKNRNLVRYNLLPDEKVSDCHQIVGTFPNKTYLLSNDVLLEVFDNYYKYTCRSNNSGDYIICGVPTGLQTLHMDLDLSDCGILSQRPRDFIYKGYNIEQFESPNKFKDGTDYNNLSQVVTQDQIVDVIPFWGNESDGQMIGLTRADIEVSYKFEPTCVFIGSVISDNSSNGITKKCVPTKEMGKMDKLVTGEGTIEMIRKTPGGNVEEFQIKGSELINGNGVWCYQIPMNLDYMMTDEYGNMVPTDDPGKGIPTRTRVRFRISMNDSELNVDNFFRCKVLVPNTNDYNSNVSPDYNFGTSTREESFRDLYWNYVYTVKSYIPRIQKSSSYNNFLRERFSGIKACNLNGGNNPLPYNNIRIRVPFMYKVLCTLVQNYVKLVTSINSFLGSLENSMYSSAWVSRSIREAIFKRVNYIMINGLCDEMEGWYFAPGAIYNKDKDGNYLQLTNNTLQKIQEKSSDETSIESINEEPKTFGYLTNDVSYLMSCFEIALAEQYDIYKFDFYNDWVNGVIYIPRFMRYVLPKKRYLWGAIKVKAKTKGCINDIYTKANRKYYQQCALKYSVTNNSINVISPNGCKDDTNFQCHKKSGVKWVNILGHNGGIVNETVTSREQSVYYLKPYELRSDRNANRVYLFATDLVLLGSLNECDKDGVPQAFKYLSNTTYILPPPLAETTLDGDNYVYTPSETGNTVQFIIDPNGALSVVNKYYNKAKATEALDDSIIMEEGDDSIVVTERAGIAWNYTGPGQDYFSDGENGGTLSPEKYKKELKDMRKKLYNPGGHFLGLSCSNVETNIKTCINLERICEAGAGMSERQEVPIGYEDITSSITYGYMVPNGLISTDEISEPEFRSMFATMNTSKLIATDSYENGYPKYGFIYSRTDGFDGSLSNKVTAPGNKAYNRLLTGYVTDETEYEGVTPDVFEPEHSFMRSLEYTNNDYINFRFGNSKNLAKRFVGENGGVRTLPQYENSFYFYFGLREGSTSLEEFNKQFFSPCESNTLIFEPKLILNSEFDFTEEHGGTIIYTAMNIDDPDTLTYGKVGEDGTTETISTPTGTITNLVRGTYVVTISNSEGVTVSDTIDVGSNISFDAIFIPFKTKKDIEGRIKNCNGRAGGYLLLKDEFTLDGITYTGGTINQRTITYSNDDNVINIGFDWDQTTTSFQPSIDSFEDENGVRYFRVYSYRFIGTLMYIEMNFEGSQAFIKIDSYKISDNSDLDIVFNEQYFHLRGDDNNSTVLKVGEWK